MASFSWSRFTGASIGLMGMGYLLMKATTPTEDQLYNEMAPDLRRKVDAARAARLAREAEMKKQVEVQVANDATPEATKPIWADSPSPGPRK
ncbi:Assembly factor CBP4 [Hypsizygus marmoreus]|uniref:Assembly factor CBP4 n=1 Tax=Hypsizygus marmoreus TaxID=39966 RepID=A0A369JPB1_HYPMA|nr:Assembly factor CBP4 [Hypsizygus marmoreus]